MNDTPKPTPLWKRRPWVIPTITAVILLAIPWVLYFGSRLLFYPDQADTSLGPPLMFLMDVFVLIPIAGFLVVAVTSLISNANKRQPVAPVAMQRNPKQLSAWDLFRYIMGPLMLVLYFGIFYFFKGGGANTAIAAALATTPAVLALWFLAPKQAPGYFLGCILAWIGVILYNNQSIWGTAAVIGIAIAFVLITQSVRVIQPLRKGFLTGFIGFAIMAVVGLFINQPNFHLF